MTRDRLKTAVVGAGYVGIATAVGLAEQGRDIVLVEQDPNRLAALSDGRIPFHEPGLPEAYATQHAAGRIVPTAEIPGTAWTSSSSALGRRSTTRATPAFTRFEQVRVCSDAPTDGVRVAGFDLRRPDCRYGPGDACRRFRRSVPLPR